MRFYSASSSSSKKAVFLNLQIKNRGLASFISQPCSYLLSLQRLPRRPPRLFRCPPILFPGLPLDLDRIGADDHRVAPRCRLGQFLEQCFEYLENQDSNFPIVDFFFYPYQPYLTTLWHLWYEVDRHLTHCTVIRVAKCCTKGFHCGCRPTISCLI